MSTEKIMEQAQVFASAWSVVGGPFDGGDAMEVATQEKAELKRMVAELAAERDTLAAKLADLERYGEEPVFWYRPRSDGQMHEGKIHNAQIDRVRRLSGAWVPLYARPVPAEPVNARLLTAARAVVARWETPLWKDAPATAGFIYEMRDAIAACAEAAPKAVRLTHADIAKALASAGLMPEDYREDGEILPLVIAIESAALHKNGIEVAE